MKYLRHINEAIKNIITCTVEPFSCREDDLIEIKALFSKLKLNFNVSTDIVTVKNQIEGDLIDEYLEPSLAPDRNAYHATASDIVSYIFQKSGKKLNLSKVGSELHRLGFKGQYKQNYNTTKHKYQSRYVYLVKNK